MTNNMFIVCKTTIPFNTVVLRLLQIIVTALLFGVSFYFNALGNVIQIWNLEMFSFKMV